MKPWLESAHTAQRKHWSPQTWEVLAISWKQAFFLQVLLSCCGLQSTSELGDGGKKEKGVGG